ncbi:hypothetical protein H6G80_06710 [Nostoc sp. FACHB-87]|uniref:hypothetical protein n=1 Tax=Nostocaceae TaxID=1162 RepID=UPI001685F975|nr:MULTISPECIES: hypothetical protein [Nostocaceae]MBD2453766.1 hypothetical protein [Nostoc sp. FACHB-87]MBD2475278.1 hypothetical protein [Anabaena sp. FACHB-83]
MLDILTVKQLTTDIKFFSNFFNSGKAYYLNELESLPDSPGIYVVALTKEKELEEFSQILYIGVAAQQSVQKRWQSHHKIRAFTFIQKLVESSDQNACIVIYASSFMNLPEDSLKALEEKLIYDLQPPFNEVKTYPAKYYCLQCSQTFKRLARTMEIVDKNHEYMRIAIPADVYHDLKEIIVSYELNKLINYTEKQSQY